MRKQFDRHQARERRHSRVRNRVEGTAAQPRLSVYRSLLHTYAQIIDDGTGRTLVSASTVQLKAGKNDVGAAAAVGKSIADKAKEAGVTRVVFDRGGFKYHGRVKALADAAREGGLEF
jgi:large subunit ribosomal protein L18